MDKSAEKYFEHFAEYEQQIAFDLFKQLKQKITYQHVLCIPAFDESFSNIEQLFQNIDQLANDNFQNTQKNLLILVINSPLSEDNSNVIAQAQIGDMQAAQKRTQALARDITHTYPALHTLEHISLYCLRKHTDLLLIQRTALQGLPYKQGVGLARKIANDCAARLIYEKCITQSIIFNSDADVIFPDNYFSQLTNANLNKSAWLFSFQHQNLGKSEEDSLNTKACHIYQESLHHYVEGLDYANSPFAFQTIGSTIAINVKHYIEVRGFPKKNAGEDFYLLNKLRKLAPIETLQGKPLLLSTRQSHRVAFGTGPAIKSMNKNNQPETSALFYQEDCFTYLRSFNAFWQAAYNRRDTISDLESLYALNAKLAQTHQHIIDDKIFRNLLHTRASKLNLIDKIKKAQSLEKWQQEFMQSFDGFQTLKLLHYLRDEYFPALTYEQIKSKAGKRL